MILLDLFLNAANANRAYTKTNRQRVNRMERAARATYRRMRWGVA